MCGTNWYRIGNGDFTDSAHMLGFAKSLVGDRVFHDDINFTFQA